MVGAGNDDEANSKRENKPKPYAPSWINRVTTWVALLPGPSWPYFLGLGLVLVLVQALVLWIEGASLIRAFHPAHGFLAGAIAFMLALFGHLDERAGAALKVMRPALEATEGEYHELQYRLTTLPGLLTLLASLLALAVVFLTEAVGEPYHLEALDSFALSANLLRITYLVCWWVFGAFLYHTLHQLSLINRIYTQYTRINLFRMKPLYAFPALTALTAGGLAVLPLGFLASHRISNLGSLDPVSLAVILAVQFLAIATFLWPQLGVHRLQVSEKDRLLDEANQRLEATILELHRRVDEGELEKMSDLRMTMAGLEMELNTLARIPTWPWEPETVQWLATALVIPLGLWILQFVMQRMLGP